MRAVADAPSCAWCGRPFTPRQGGSPRVFCRAAHRHAYHRAARQWCEREIAEGRLAIQDLRDGAAAAYTLARRDEQPLPLPDIGGGDTASSDALARFLVAISRDRIACLVRCRFLPADQQNNLTVVMAAMARLGWAPIISRIPEAGTRLHAGGSQDPLVD